MKKLLLGQFCFVLLLFNVEVSALGLGELTVTSDLNEPLQASIQLTGLGDLTEREIIIELASKETFEEMGVDREFVLTALMFELDTSSTNAVIKITSQQAIREPYLDFLLNLQWPKGQMMREYTIMLNPPKL